MATLSYMEGLMPEGGSDLDVRYHKVLFSFEELNKLPPNALMLGMGEFIRKVLLDNSGKTRKTPGQSTKSV